MHYLLLFLLSVILMGCEPASISTVDDARGKALVDIHGQPWKFADYRGKWIIVNYWASWCKPCVTEVPELEAFYLLHKDKDAIIVGVNYDFVSEKETQKMAEKYGITYPVLSSEHDPREQLGVDPVMVLPTTFIVNPEGQVVAALLGEQTQATLEKEITP